SILIVQVTRSQSALIASKQSRTTRITSSNSPSSTVPIGFSRYGTPLRSMMSRLRATYWPTDSPLPSGDIENSSNMAITDLLSRASDPTQSPARMTHDVSRVLTYHPIVKRTAIYWGIILVGAGLALAARIWSGLRHNTPSDAPTAQRIRDTLDPPRDHVMLPWVAPAEKGAGPRRIISLAPSITETICALGLFDRLVGRTQYCTYPPIVDAVPALGAMTDTNFERIRMLEPDIIFITENSGELHRTLSADRKSTRLNSSHVKISYAVFCLKKTQKIELTRSRART